MLETPNLALPLLAAAQAQKHVTHNEALLALDTLLHCAVLDRDLAAPPVAPAEGARYIVPASPTAAWAGMGGQIAAWQNGAWSYHLPKAGFTAYVVDEEAFVLFDGAGWISAMPAALQNLARVGIGTAANAGNPFSAKLNAALWTARPAGEGGTGDLRYTLNKEAAANVLSLLFQTGYGGRAELGLIGDDDIQLKVSLDGTAWTDALRVKPDGKVGIGASAPPERLTVAGNIAPATDNAYSFGTPSRRASAIYVATGVINTSDLRAKRDVEPIDPALAMALLRATPPIAFRWLSGGTVEVPSQGRTVLEERPGRRRHFGWSAQDWRDALEEADQDAGLLVKTDPANPDSELGLRPDQIVAVLHAAVLGLAEEVGRLGRTIAGEPRA